MKKNHHNKKFKQLPKAKEKHYAWGGGGQCLAHLKRSMQMTLVNVLSDGTKQINNMGKCCPKQLPPKP